ncbi:phosphotransferase [Promicromonospora iranensis]|uniref:phosphotransferase n=1 Tax=Promicromonospora iranensis TaxID=1105144 RepID=UPI0023A9AFC6|nr:phosphotransferase [Promicromonospora iranensis]
MQHDDQVLSGGFVSTVTRRGAEVHRSMPERHEYVHELLRYLAEQGWSGAPRLLRVEPPATEVLSYLDGLSGADDGVRRAAAKPSCLAALARLVRELHDLTAGTALAGDSEVVCHHDIDPRNTVFRHGASGVVPVAFVDWDIAGPGRRIEDVAHLVWQFVPLGPATDVGRAARALTTVCDAYGPLDRSELVPTALWWQHRCADGIDAGARAGEPAMVRLAELGVPDAVRQQAAWTTEHAEELARLL